MGDAKAHNFSQTAAVLEMRNEDEEIEKFLREEEAWLRKKREREKFWDSVRQFESASTANSMTIRSCLD